MIKAYIETDDEDQIGVHEFIALPFIGASIAVIDQHANMHHLRVTQVRIRGLGVGEDFALARAVTGEVHVTIVGSRDASWPVELED